MLEDRRDMICRGGTQHDAALAFVSYSTSVVSNISLFSGALDFSGSEHTEWKSMSSVSAEVDDAESAAAGAAAGAAADATRASLARRSASITATYRSTTFGYNSNFFAMALVKTFSRMLPIPVIFIVHSSLSVNAQLSPSTLLHRITPRMVLFLGLKNVLYDVKLASYKYGAVDCSSSTRKSSNVSIKPLPAPPLDAPTPSALRAKYGNVTLGTVRTTYLARVDALSRSYNGKLLSRSPKTARSHAMNTALVRARQSVSARSASVGVSNVTLTMPSVRRARRNCVDVCAT